MSKFIFHHKTLFGYLLRDMPKTGSGAKAITGVFALLLLALPTETMAWEPFLQAFPLKYEGSSSASNTANGCQLCHQSSNPVSPGRWNGYGSAIQQRGSETDINVRMTAVESLNSDLDFSVPPRPRSMILESTEETAGVTTALALLGSVHMRQYSAPYG